MSSSSETARPVNEPKNRLQRSLHQARYLWLEELLHGRRLLEVGLIDAQILKSSGASQAWATTHSAAEVEAARAAGVTAVLAEVGVIPFADANFDAVVVPSFARQWDAAPQLLSEVRRVLVPSGFALLVLEGEGGWWQPDLPSGEDLRQRIRRVFPDAQFCLEAPFVGVRLGSADTNVDLSLDDSMASAGGEAQVLALVGKVEAEERTLVQLPLDVVSAANETRVDRLSEALQKSRGELSATKQRLAHRERALAEVAQRLPRLRAAVQTRLSLAPAASQVVEPTVLERPGPAPKPDLSEALEVSERKLLEAEEQLSRLRSSEAESSRVQVAEVEWSSVGPSATIIQTDWERHDDVERDRLSQQLEQERAERMRLNAELLREREDRLRAETHILKLSDELADAGPPPAPTEALTALPEVRAETHLDERFDQLTLRATQLERALTYRDEEVARLEHELAGQLEARHVLGSEIEDSGARFLRMSAELEELRLVLAAQEEQANRDKQSMAALLSRADAEKERLELEYIETQQTLRALTDVADQAAHALHHEREQQVRMSRELDTLHRELAGRQHDGQLQALVEEQDRLLREADAELRAKDSGQRAVEMAASHLSKEVEVLRRRVMALRNERDTLASAAASLVEERDLARAEVHATPRTEDLETEYEVRLQRALEPLERQLEGALGRAESLDRDRASLSERCGTLAADLDAARDAAAQQETEGQAVRDLARSLDQRLAEHQVALSSIEGARDSALSRARELEMMLFESATSTQEAFRAAEHEQALQEDLREQLRIANHDLAEALAHKAKAEAEAIEIGTADLEAKSALALRAAEHAEALAEVRSAFEAEGKHGQAELLRAKDAELSDLQEALSKTLEQAAHLASDLSEAERALKEATADLERGERELMEVESQRQNGVRELRGSEAARRHAVAEVQELAQRLSKASFERDELLRQLDARSVRVRELEDEVTEARVSQLPIPVLDEPIDDPWPRLYQEARTECLRLTEELEAAQFRVQTPAPALVVVEERIEFRREVAKEAPGRWDDVESSLEIAVGRQTALELEAAELREVAAAHALSLSGVAAERTQLELRIAQLQAEAQLGDRHELELQRELAVLSQELEQLHREQETTAQIAQAASTRVDEVEVELSLARARQEHRGQEVAQLQSALEQAVADRDIARHLADFAEQHSQDLGARLEDVSREASQTQLATNDLDLRLQHTEDELKAAEDQRVDLARRASEQHSLLREAQIQLEQETTRSQRLQHRLLELMNAAEQPQLASASRVVFADPESAGEHQLSQLREQLEAARSQALFDRVAAYESQESAIAPVVVAAPSGQAEERAGRAELAAAEATRRATEAERELARMKVAYARAEAEQGRFVDEVSRAKEQLAESHHRLQRLESERTVNERKVLELERALDKRRAKDAASPQPLGSQDLPQQAPEQLEHLTAQLRRTERELDEARAETGRKMVELREADARQTRMSRQTEMAHQDIERLQDKLRRSGDADELQLKLAEMGRQVAGQEAERDALEEDLYRLRRRLSDGESAGIERDREVARLEGELAERDRRLEYASREIAERSEQIRRLKDRS